MPPKPRGKIVRYKTPRATGPAAVTSERRVFGAGVPGATVHLLASRGELTDTYTKCGNWPGRPADLGGRECPVCFP